MNKGATVPDPTTPDLAVALAAAAGLDTSAAATGVTS